MDAHTGFNPDTGVVIYEVVFGPTDVQISFSEERDRGLGVGAARTLRVKPQLVPGWFGNFTDALRVLIDESEKVLRDQAMERDVT